MFKGGFPDYSGDPGPNDINWLNDAALDLPIFRCPSDRGYTGYHLPPWSLSRLSSFHHYGTSYSSNALWLAKTWMEEETGEIPCKAASLGPLLRPISRVPNPANTVYYIENAGRFAWLFSLRHDRPRRRYLGCLSYRMDPWQYNTEQIKGWHGRPFHFTSAFVDGHATMVKMEGRQFPPPKLPSYPQYPWMPIDPNDRRQLWASWVCAIIRGPEWQLDCLPAGVIETDVACHLPPGANVVTPGFGSSYCCEDEHNDRQ